MLKTRSLALIGSVALALAAVTAHASFTLRRDAVLPIEFTDALSVKSTRVGDQFTVRVTPGLEVPYGTRLAGRVRSVRPGREDVPSTMDLEFTDILLPDGSSQPLRAIPIALSDSRVRRDRDGRLSAKRDPNKTAKYALGGALGGMILGSINRKGVEGALIGAVAGAVVAESDRDKEEATVVRKGQKMGALIERELRVIYRDREGDRDRDREDDRDRDRRDDPPRSIQIEVGRDALQFDRRTDAYREGDVVMVALEATAKQLHLDVEVVNDGIIYASNDEGSLRFACDSIEARHNGKRFALPHAVVRRDGVVYVPIEALAKLSSETIRVDGMKIGSPA